MEIPPHKKKSLAYSYGLALVLFWTCLVVVSLSLNVYQIHKNNLQEAAIEARTHLELNLEYRSLIAQFGGVYASIEKISPNPYLRIPGRDITTTDGKELTLLNPAYITRLIFEKVRMKSDCPVINKITSLNAYNPVNAPDVWEKKALMAFEGGRQEESEVTGINGSPYLRLMKPFITEQGCLKCHKEQGYKVGDVRGGISIAVPLDPYYKTEAQTRKTSVITHALLWLIGTCGLIIFSRFKQRADDELTKHRLHLEDLVSERTDELTKANKELEEAYARLKHAQTAILQQEKMASIGQLAAGVAHEINNPLGFIISNLGTLQKYAEKLTDFIQLQERSIREFGTVTADLDERRKSQKLDYITGDIGKLISESLDGAERVRRIVQDLRSFSCIDEAEVKTTDVNVCMESTLNILQNELKNKTVIRKEFGRLPEIECNPGQLNQAFMNIMLNAVQAIEGQGEIAIRTWLDDKNICISIADTGCGIPPENIKRIFEPFFTTKPVGKGTGLGLSIAYDIITKHHGEIKVDSEMGKGTTFTIAIPVGSGGVQ